MPSSQPSSSPSSSSQRASKLRSPAYRAERLSYTNSGNSKSYYALLPPTIQYLDQLQLSMEAERPDSKTKDVRYVLRIHKKQTELRWSVSHTYSEYRELQKRLLSVMQLGHFCNAECPWMYSFVKSQFPKECRFYSSTKYVVRKRLEAFQNCMATLHAHLVNRENHCCSVVTTAVAMEIISFISADLPEDSEARYAHFGSKNLSSSSSSTDSSASSASLPMLDISIRYTDLESSSSDANAKSTRSARSSRSSDCSLCSPSSHHHHHQSAKSPTSIELHPENHSDDDSDGAASVTSSSAYSRDLCQSFTTLSCGHQFHDECILEKLNESMSCPTCGHVQALS